MAEAPTISHAEAIQVSALLEDCVESLRILDDMTPDVFEHRQELAEMVGEEISRIIEDRRDLERRYDELLSQRAALKSLANKTQFRAVELELRELTIKLRTSAQVLSRNLKENPNIADNLRKIQSERSSLQVLIHRTLTELENQSFGTLLRTVDEEKTQQDSLIDTIQKEKIATQRVKDLTAELAREEKKKTESVHQLNIDITKLKTELQILKAQTMENYTYKKKEYVALKFSRKRQWEETERALVEKLNDLEKRILVEKRCHARIEDFLARTNEELQQDIEHWDARYAEEAQAKTSELEKLTREQQQLTHRLHKLKQDYRSAKEYVDKDRAQRKAEEAARLYGLKMGEAALTLQCVWKGYSARKAHALKKKKAKPAIAS